MLVMPALAEQEARRAKNTASGETETRMRGATWQIRRRWL